MTGRGPDDDREIDRLREGASERDAEIARLRAQAADDREEIAHLRSDAAIREAILAVAREDLAAAERELDDLRAVRDALTPPTLPDRPGLELSAVFEAATRGVSGDFYLAVDGPGDTTVIVVGDVTGKGIEAARRAVFVRASFAAAAGFSGDPCLLLRSVNAALAERPEFDGCFATAVCAGYSPASQELRWALAGHPPPLRLRTGERLGGPPALPLGVEDELECTAQTLVLAPGEGLLLYTDGLVEARREGEQFGEERAAQVLREMAGRPAVDVLGRLRAEVTAFSDERLADDLCLLDMRAA